MGYKHGLEGSEFNKWILFGKKDYIKGYADGEFARMVDEKFVDFCNKLKEKESHDYLYHCMNRLSLKPGQALMRETH
jgi:hypothetical protein